ncbi:7-deoxyloganetin glucosyltransferase-like [Mercurialis annua]|uniref:7-deoxyloganetin glucosyltransferase-like n=1 Tax=Mercurialis annua TaxID=3986 RepID=UPI0021601548|nr:7-deoxyloganetin glucosyltransferase-like [Mercurialis annua]
MDPIARDDKPHVVCVPYPAQGHVTPMMKLAKLLHYNNCHITFVNTEYNHRRLLNSRGSDSLEGLPDFRFEAISDGLPPSDANSTQDIPALCESTSKYSLAPFRELLLKLKSCDDLPGVSCIISDGCMSFTLDAAEEFGIPEILFWTPSACGVLGYAQYQILMDKGLTPLKDASYLTNGYLETTLDWVPGMKNIRLRDFPSFIRTTDKNDIMLNFLTREIARTRRATGVVFNTFYALEKEVIDALSNSTSFPPIYAIGPLKLLVDQIPDEKKLEDIGSNLWKEELECIEWLDTKEPGSVVYVNFGSITVITPDQMMEFAWGLANSKKPFLWIIRPDLVVGENAMLPVEFVSETKDRGMLASWCPQEKILKHSAVGGFLSHMGWNSTLDTICGGVPMVCWPFFAEQQTNCRFACVEWGVGMEIDNNVKRDEVEKLVKELMDGEKGKEMKNKAMEWKKKAEEATEIGGSSHYNLDELVKFIISLKS